MKKPLSEAKSGDVVCVDRGLYKHYGVYDHGKVIDVSLKNDAKALRSDNAHVSKKPMQRFLKGDPGYVDNSPGKRSRKKTLKRARAEVGTGGSYNLFTNNCEHKARGWETGHKHSKQVDDSLGFFGGLLGEIIDGFR